MKLSRATLFHGLATLGVVCVVVLIVYVVFKSPTGYYARKHADLELVTQESPEPYITLEGTPTTLNDGSYEATVVTLWASWSPFSAQDFRALDTIKTSFGTRIALKALNRMETTETARAYLLSVTAPETIEYIIDNSDTFYDHFGGFAMPETIVFDGVGNAVYHKRGTIDTQELEDVLKNILSTN